jgi:hypothetical protein
MQKWEPQAAVAVVGLASIELWKMWQKSAPTLQDVRTAEPGCISTRQKLLDAEITVGSMALIIGAALAILTHDMTALIMLIVIFAALAFLHHWILAAEQR